MRDNRAETLGFNIKIERLRIKMTQAVLAEKANISLESVIKIEGGKQTPSALVLYDISKALNTDIKNLFKDIDKG